MPLFSHHKGLSHSPSRAASGGGGGGTNGVTSPKTDTWATAAAG